MAAPMKKSFEFRMSKKVAELTQVVHMLFTRNHEKEVELEALKNAYEYEIELVIKDAKSRIDKIQTLLYDSERLRHGDNNKLKASIQNDQEKMEQNWKKKVETLEHQLLGEKLECSTARDMLINAQQDMERLKSSQVKEIQQKQQDILNRDKEIERLKRVNMDLEKQYGQSDSKSQNALLGLKKAYETLETDCNKVRDNLDESERTRDRLVGRNRQLENEVKLLKKELGRKAGERSARSSASNPRQDFMEYSSASIMDYGEEMEKLRRLVARYRMELSNRDSNFNRMFSDHTPVIVNKRTGSRGSPQDGTPSTPMRLNRERSNILSQSMPLGGASGTLTNFSVITTEEEIGNLLQSPRGSSKSISSSSGNRLPTVEQRNRLQRLAKPRPLSKTMLTASK